MSTSQRQHLARKLLLICAHDTNYARRYCLVLEALADASRMGWVCGLSYDKDSGPDMDGFRIVANIEIPETYGGGQISWHMPEYTCAWDGHTTPEKFERIQAFAAAVNITPSIPMRKPQR